MLEVSESKPFNAVEAVNTLEGMMLDLPQAEVPVVHHFGPGVCIREVTLPAGIFAIGHHQKFEHLNVVIKGAVAMTADDGSVRVIRAPMIFTGKPGRKFGYVLEETVWQNIYPTSETDVEKIESYYIDKSEAWKDANKKFAELEYAARHEDREDFKSLIAAAGFTEEIVRAQSENEHDQIPMPSEWSASFSVRDSSIEGKGGFLSRPAVTGEVLVPARIGGKRTPAGRYLNHSKTPNCEFVITQSGDAYVVAIRDIQGCLGGGPGEELTVDYRQGIRLAGILIEETNE